MNAVNSAVPALEARGLVRRFGALVATDQVSLSLAPGEIHALIGPNGAGKSTLIHLLSGTLAADAGKLLLGGRDVTGMNAHQRVAAACRARTRSPISSSSPRCWTTWCWRYRRTRAAASGVRARRDRAV